MAKSSEKSAPERFRDLLHRHGIKQKAIIAEIERLGGREVPETTLRYYMSATERSYQRRFYNPDTWWADYMIKALMDKGCTEQEAAELFGRQLAEDRAATQRALNRVADNMEDLRKENAELKRLLKKALNTKN